MRINLAITAPKSNAENEKDPVNTNWYPEDKLMTLLLAYDRKDQEMLKFLLDEGYKIWPSKCIPVLLSEKMNTDIQEYARSGQTNQSKINQWT